MKALRIAASGMMAQQYNTEVVANNLANMNTTGYQRRRTEFSDLIYDVAERKPSRSSKAGNAVPGGGDRKRPRCAHGFHLPGYRTRISVVHFQHL
jgi:flagellar basal body rod protein FlgG